MVGEYEPVPDDDPLLELVPPLLEPDELEPEDDELLLELELPLDDEDPLDDDDPPEDDDPLEDDDEPPEAPELESPKTAAAEAARSGDGSSLDAVSESVESLGSTSIEPATFPKVSVIVSISMSSAEGVVGVGGVTVIVALPLVTATGTCCSPPESEMSRAMLVVTAGDVVIVTS